MGTAVSVYLSVSVPDSDPIHHQNQKKERVTYIRKSGHNSTNNAHNSVEPDRHSVAGASMGRREDLIVDRHYGVGG